MHAAGARPSAEDPAGDTSPDAEAAVPDFKDLDEVPPVSCCQLVATEYKRAPTRPATTAQNPMGTMVPANPPKLAHRLWMTQAATSTAYGDDKAVKVQLERPDAEAAKDGLGM